MPTILVTGPTGNVGTPLLQHLGRSLPADVQVLAGVRPNSLTKANVPEHVKKIVFDFDDPFTFLPALQKSNSLFLLRPGQVSNSNIMQQLVDAAKEAAVQHIVFLSVQGADKMKWTPHHKIETMISNSGIAYTFLRPAYFMQNFEGPLLKDLKERSRIFLPAGRAHFPIVDADDVAKCAASILLSAQPHLNKAYDLTNSELLSFSEMAAILSQTLNRKINFESPSLLRFFLQKKKDGMPAGFILIMMVLHYLPRFSAPPPLSNFIAQITGRPPCTFKEYILRKKVLFS